MGTVLAHEAKERIMTCITTQSHPLAADSTVVTAADPQELSPLEAVIMDLCNALIEARTEASDGRAGHAAGEIASIERALFDAVGRYEQTNAQQHPNADWAIPNQRALALSAAGRYDEAIETELLALDHADSPRRLEISLGNLAERCIKADRFEEAVAWFLEAQEVAPGRTPILLTGAQALCLAGYEDEANAIFATLLESDDLLKPGSELDAYLRYESRLLGMADRLPALRELLITWRRVCADGTASEEDAR
jgi:tetratricopeptide (TPR) repeat protein